jgi:thiol-disulfide isomerase/thioredoxin
MLVLLLACIPELHTPGGADTAAAALACGETLPTNSWPAETPPGTVSGTGFDVGDTLPDACLSDQYGATVDLWQLYGRVWVLDVSTGWCAPCRQLAEEAPGIIEDYADEAFNYVTVMPQNVVSEPPTTEDVAEWADEYGITQPVLADVEGWAYGITENSFPTLLLIDRDLSIVDNIQPATDATIRAAIDEAL